VAQNMNTSSRFSILICVGALLLSLAARADDWPQWRGPKRDGVWRETGIVKTLKGPRMPLLWRAKVYGGYTGPTVAAGRVYLMDHPTDPVEMERVLCFEAKTGKLLWEHAYDCIYEIQYPLGPRASVSIHDGRAYSLGSMGHLLCLDAVKGTVLWRKEPGRDYRIRMPIWGIACAPLVEGELVIVQIGARDGACVMAFDRKTGEERWRALDDRCSYSAPMPIDHAGKRIVVCWTGDSIAGLDARTGQIYWRYSSPSKKWADATSTPVFSDGRLFFTGFIQGSIMLRLLPGKAAVEPAWKRAGRNERHTEALHSLIPTPIVDGDCIYGVDSYGQLRGLNASNGDRLWENLDIIPNLRWATAHLIRHEDKVWMFNETGELLITQFSPKGFQVISRSMLIDPVGRQAQRRGGVCWSHPAFANKHIYQRNHQQLVCSSLEAK